MQILVEGVERDVEMLKSKIKLSQSKLRSLTPSSYSDNSVLRVKSTTKSDISIHENHFALPPPKSSSLNNIVDLNDGDSLSDDDDDDFLSFSVFQNQKTSNKLTRSRSSNELNNSDDSPQMREKLKLPSAKVRKSVMKKISPHLGRKKNVQSKNAKNKVGMTYHKNQSHISEEEVNDSLISFKFLEMHGKFREDIILFLSS